MAATTAGVALFADVLVLPARGKNGVGASGACPAQAIRARATPLTANRKP
jgi:hypothetical protein